MLPCSSVLLQCLGLVVLQYCGLWQDWPGLGRGVIVVRTISISFGQPRSTGDADTGVHLVLGSGSPCNCLCHLYLPQRSGDRGGICCRLTTDLSVVGQVERGQNQVPFQKIFKKHTLLSPEGLLYSVLTPNMDLPRNEGAAILSTCPGCIPPSSSLQCQLGSG
jgi:hypothetical protein